MTTENDDFLKPHLKKWWAARTEDQRDRLKQAAQSATLEPDAVDLLFKTSCPFGPIGGKWETQEDWDWNWPSNVRTFVLAQETPE